MYQTTFDSETRFPASSRSPQSGSLLENICDRLKQALKFRPARKSRTDHALTFIEENLLDDVMGPEIKRSLRI